MNHPASLLARLDAIGASLARSGHALALLGLGSVGVEQERLDAYSDLDFFAIVETGHKARYIDQLEWLSDICPVAYAFRNTADGYKLLFADGIFCEFAVFEPAELRTLPYPRGRIVWKRPEVDDAVAAPAVRTEPHPPHAVEWQLGEALTNLYVGLGRYRRGEKLSAARFIQGYAVDRVLELAAQVEPEMPVAKDPFSSERRFERRFPQTAAQLPAFVQGYDRTCESALAILAFLEAHFPVNPAIATAIRHLATLP